MVSRAIELQGGDIDIAFANEEFVIVYQPKIDLATGSVTGTEALARWYHHNLGELPPSLFVPFLLRQGRLIELTRFALTRGIEAAAAWRLEGHRWPVHVNISAEDLFYEGLAQFVSIRLRSHGLPPDVLRLELREVDLMSLRPVQRHNLKTLLASGVTLAVQGPATLTHRDCEDIPVAEFQLKGPALLALATALSAGEGGKMPAVIEAAKKRGRETTAIALETNDQVEAARALGFDSATGYAFAKPMPLEDFLYWASMREPEATRRVGSR